MAFNDLPDGATRLSKDITYTTFVKLYPNHDLCARVMSKRAGYEGRYNDFILYEEHLDPWRESHQYDLANGLAFLYADPNSVTQQHRQDTWFIARHQAGRAL